MNLHLIFYTSLLRKNFEDFLSKQILLLSSSVIIDNEQKFDVKDIIDSRLIKRIINKRLQYKIKRVEHFLDWKWYSRINFDHVKEIVIDFPQRYSNKSESQSLIVQFLTISLISYLINSFKWAQHSIQKTKNMIQNILNKMKKKMNQTSIFRIEQNIINDKTISQDSFVIKTISAKKILFNQNWKKIVSRFCVYLLIMWSTSRRLELINEIKRRRVY